MDKTLELSLIESGYDPTHADQVSLEDVGRIIKDEMYPLTSESNGSLFFDGQTYVAVRTGLGHSIMKKPSLVITSGNHGMGGLYIYSPQDTVEGQRSSVYLELRPNTSVEVPNTESYRIEHSLDLVIQDEGSEQAKVELIKIEDTPILYLPRVDGVQQDSLFWNSIANQLGLELENIGPKYNGVDVANFYTAKKEGVEITLGNHGLYRVRANFEEEKTADELRQLVDGLTVNPQTVDGDWVGENISKGGHVFEVHVNQGLGDQVVAYIANVLRKANPVSKGHW